MPFTYSIHLSSAGLRRSTRSVTHCASRQEQPPATVSENSTASEMTHVDSLLEPYIVLKTAARPAECDRGSRHRATHSLYWPLPEHRETPAGQAAATRPPAGLRPARSASCPRSNRSRTLRCRSTLP